MDETWTRLHEILRKKNIVNEIGKIYIGKWKGNSTLKNHTMNGKFMHFTRILYKKLGIAIQNFSQLNF